MSSLSVSVGRLNRQTVLLAEKGPRRWPTVLGASAFEGDAHSLLIAIYKDGSQLIELRLEAAKAAIRFEKPALAAVDATGTSKTSIMQLQTGRSPATSGTSNSQSPIELGLGPSSPDPSKPRLENNLNKSKENQKNQRAG